MKKLPAVLLIFLAVALQGCFLFQKGAKVGKEYTTDSGLKYTITEKGSGDQPKEGDKIKVHYTGRLTDGTKFDSSVDRGQPFVFPLGKGRVIKGWDEGFALLSEGDKAKLTIPPEIAYGSTARGKIPANSTLVFDVEFLEILEPPKPFDVEGKDTLRMESGLKYIKVNTTKGQQAEAFRTVAVHYTGYLNDETIFDSSVERGQPIEFQLGVGKVIKGWDEGISYLRVGEKARLIIPPKLAYGERGFPPTIPANSTLIFDVELLEIKE